MAISVRGLVNPATRHVAAVISEGERHSLLDYHRSSWLRAASWTGPTVWDVCACGDAVLAIDEAHNLHVLRHGRDILVTVEGTEPLYAVEALDPETAIIVGDVGKIWVYSTITGAVRRIGLGSLGVKKPGRTILNASNIHGRVFLLGRNRLICQLEGDHCRELVRAGSSTERNLAVHYIAESSGGYLVSGLLGLEGALARVVDGQLDGLALPQAVGIAAPLCAFDEGVFLLTESLWLRTADTWVIELLRQGDDSFVGMGRLETGNLVAVTEHGCAFERIGGKWKEIASVPQTT